MVCKVVSIEDEPEIAELLRIVLFSPQIDVYSCDNGPEGIQLIRACKPDLVILDIMLPGMNGWAIYDAIRSDEDLKMTPVVMLSVLREAPERRQAFVSSPIDLYVTKPFDTLRLRSDIERMLGRKGLWPVTKPLARSEESKLPEDLSEKPAVDVKLPPFGNGSRDGSTAEQPPDVPNKPAVASNLEKPVEQIVSASEKPAVANAPEKPAELSVSIPEKPAEQTPDIPEPAVASAPDKPAEPVADAQEKAPESTALSAASPQVIPAEDSDKQDPPKPQASDQTNKPVEEPAASAKSKPAPDSGATTS